MPMGPIGADTAIDIGTRVVGLAKKWKWVGATVGVLGRPIEGKKILDMQHGEKQEEFKDKTKGPLWFLRRHVFLWGYLAGLLGLVGTFVIGRVLKAIPEGQAASRSMTWGHLASWALTLIGFGGALYSDVSTTNVETACGINAGRQARVGELLKDPEVVTTRENSKLVDLYKNNRRRYNDEESLKEYDPSDPTSPKNEWRDLKELVNQKRLKGLLHGTGGTGKSDGMDFVAGGFMAGSGKPLDTFIVKYINGNILSTKIRQKVDAKIEAAEAIASMGGERGSKVASIISASAQETLIDILELIKAEGRAAKKNNKEFIVQFDEIDKIFSLAQEEGKEPDDNFLTVIGAQIAEIFEKSDVNILMASNETMRKLFRLDRYDNKEMPGSLKGVVSRLEGPSRSISLPSFSTQQRIIALQLLGIAEEFKVSEERIFDKPIYDAIRGCKTFEEKEMALAKYTKKQIYDKLKKGSDWEKLYRLISGRNLRDFVEQGIQDTYLKTGQKLKPGAKITIAQIKEKLDSIAKSKREIHFDKNKQLV